MIFLALFFYYFRILSDFLSRRKVLTYTNRFSDFFSSYLAFEWGNWVMRSPSNRTFINKIALFWYSGAPDVTAGSSLLLEPPRVWTALPAQFVTRPAWEALVPEETHKILSFSHRKLSNLYNNSYCALFLSTLSRVTLHDYFDMRFD